MPRQRRTFTPKFKLQMVKLYEYGKPRADFTHEYNLTASALNKTKEPPNIPIAILLSIHLMIVAVIITIGVILLLILYELLYSIFIPNFTKLEKTYKDITLYWDFVITEEEISKSRYIFITIAPFIIFSIIFQLILSTFRLLTTTLKFLVMLNSMASSVALLNLLLIIKQVRKNATLKSNGPNTY